MKMHDRILWLGNGVNLTNHQKDWTGILKELEGDTEHPIVTNRSPEPFTMMYDSLLFEKLKYGLEKNRHYKTKLAHLCREMPSEQAHQDVLKLGYRCILTTNYDHGMQKAWLDEHSNGSMEDSPVRETKFNLFRRYFLDNAELWHIHGDCKVINSLTIGFDDYVRQLCQIRAYFGGGTTTHKNRIEPAYIREPTLSTDDLFSLEISSWIDRFMLLPIDIRGYKMDYSEIDFWWLLAQKHKFCRVRGTPFDVRIFLRDGDVDNYPQLRTAERMGIKPVKCGKDYSDIYRKPINE